MELKGALAAAKSSYYAVLDAHHAEVYANAANIPTKILALLGKLLDTPQL